MEHFTKEVEDVHTFFEQYFLGKLPESDISQFELMLADGFTIVSPSGRVADRDEIIAIIRRGYNTRNNMRIWIENLVVRQQIGDTAVVTYEEWQTIDDVTTKRTSTVVFKADESRPNGVIWLHLHESIIKEVK